MEIQICVGSSCHIRGSEKIVKLFQEALQAHDIADRVQLGGSFCLGKCNKDGVSVMIDGTVYTGVSADTFSRFFHEYVLEQIQKEGQ